MLKREAVLRSIELNRASLSYEQLKEQVMSEYSNLQVNGPIAIPALNGVGEGSSGGLLDIVPLQAREESLAIDLFRSDDVHHLEPMVYDQPISHISEFEPRGCQESPGRVSPVISPYVTPTCSPLISPINSLRISPISSPRISPSVSPYGSELVHPFHSNIFPVSTSNIPAPSRPNIPAPSRPNIPVPSRPNIPRPNIGQSPCSRAPNSGVYHHVQGNSPVHPLRPNIGSSLGFSVYPSQSSPSPSNAPDNQIPYHPGQSQGPNFSPQNSNSYPISPSQSPSPHSVGPSTMPLSARPI
jgi:hypothetical protein